MINKKQIMSTVNSESIQSFDDIKVSKMINFKEMNYQIPPSNAGVIRRKAFVRDQVLNISGSGSKSNQVLRFRIPSGEYLLNPKSLYFCFHTKISGLSSQSKKDVTRISPIGAASFIQDFRLSLGGSTIEYIRDYPIISKIKQMHMTKEYKKNVMMAEGCWESDQTVNYALEGASSKREQLLGNIIDFSSTTTTSAVVTSPKFDIRKQIQGNVRSFLHVIKDDGAVFSSAIDNVQLQAGSTQNYVITLATGWTGETISYDLLTKNVFIDSVQKMSDYEKMHSSSLASGTEQENKYVHLPVASGFFNQEKFFPMFLSKSDLEINITQNDLNSIFDGTASTGVDFQITDCYVYYELLYPNVDIITKIQKRYNDNGINIPMDMYTLVQRSDSSSNNKIAENYIENITMLNKLYIMSRSKNFGSRDSRTYGFEPLNYDYQGYVEINKERYPANYDIPNEAEFFYRNLYNNGTLRDEHKIYQSYLDFLRGDSQIITVDTQKFREGKQTGINITNTNVKVQIDNVVARPRNVVVVFEHSSFLRMKAKEPLEVYS